MKGNGINEMGPPAAMPEGLESDLRYQLIQRILHSRALAKAARLRELLQFLSTHSLAGHPEEISEMAIGRSLFSRGEDFIPTEDSIVRGAVRQLRMKLREYFEMEGSAEEWRVEIPKGGFTLVFVKVEPTAEVALPRRGRLRAWLAAAVVVNAILLAGNLWWATRQQGRPEVPPSPTLVGELLARASGPVNVVVSDFSLVLMKNLVGPSDYALNDYIMWNYEKLRPKEDRGPLVAYQAETLRTHRITRFGDMSLAVGIVRAGAAAQVQVRHARDVNARDFREGNSILLGNWNSTPWFDLFEDALNFPHVRHAPGIGFTNRAPRAGEAAGFLVANASQEHGQGYGRLALVPNLSGKGDVLLISGVNMVTMESVGDFALNPAHSAELLKALGAESLEALPYFEAVLETQAVDNAPGRARIVVVRNLGLRAR